MMNNLTDEEEQDLIKQAMILVKGIDDILNYIANDMQAKHELKMIDDWMNRKLKQPKTENDYSGYTSLTHLRDSACNLVLLTRKD
jgi:hypothetical protein